MDDAVSGELCITFDEDRLEPTLEQMTRQPVTTVEMLGVDTVELPHPLR